MEGLIIDEIPNNASDERLIACLAMYGTVKSYYRNGSRAFVDYRETVLALGAVWVNDTKLKVIVRDTATRIYEKPLHVSDHIASLVHTERMSIKYSLEYFLIGFDRMSTDEVKDLIRKHFGNFILFQRNGKYAFVHLNKFYKDQYIDGKIRLELTKRCVGEEKKMGHCLACRCLNARDFTTCRQCATMRNFCIYCTLENLPNHKYCCWCGEEKLIYQSL